MNPIRNPFSPGAGSPPPELAGRSDVIGAAEILLGRVKMHKPEKSLLLTGLRGVGKTVLLNKMEALARDTGYKTIMIEAQEGRPLAAALVPALRNVLYELNLVKNAGEKARRALMILRNFIGSVKLSYGDFGIDLEPLPGKGDTGDMTMDLPELLLSVAEAAEEKESGVVILIDEMQILAPLEFASLILAMHKLQQRQAPLVLIGGGLPTIPRLAGEAKSYAERLFSYPIIGQLSLEDATAALRRPVEQEGLQFSDAAVATIYRHSQGYPYFLQEWGYQVWNNLPEDATCIQESDVDAVTRNALRRLDENFFRVRYDRLTEGEKHFMRAMAELEPGDCRTADLSKLLGKSVNALAPARSSLIKKGMIYSPRNGILAYSVPLFGDFMRRSIPVFG